MDEWDTGFDRMWIPTLQQLIRRSKDSRSIYFLLHSCLCEFMGTPVEFYDHDIYIRGTIQTMKTQNIFLGKRKHHNYTVVPKKSPEWNKFMRYLTDCFRGDSDKYFWLTKLLSLERVKPPEELYKDL